MSACNCGCEGVVVPLTDECHCNPVTACPCSLYVKNTAAFVIPNCGESVNIYVDYASRLVVGAYLYNEAVGYLKIVNIIDGTTVKVELTQDVCDSGCSVASSGSTISSCTRFIITSLGCGGGISSTSGNICLESSFYSPAVGGIVTVGISMIGNITTGAIISIEGYKYTVTEVVDDSTIKITNTGEGAPEGTKIGEDCTTECYLVTVLDTPSPCTGEPVTSGKLVVCDGLTETIMEGNIDRQIPIWDKELDKFVLEVLNENTIDCTFLTLCLTLDPELDPQEYLVTVDDSSIFEKEEYADYETLLIYINGDPYTLLSVVDPTHIRVSPFFDVTEIVEYAINDVVCIADCCSQCQPTVQTMGRYGGTEGEPSEELIVLQDLAFSIPTGVSVRNYYTATPTTDPLIAPPIDEGLYEIYYKNEGQCKRYIELTSNIAGVLNIPSGVYANVEFRTGNSRGTTQSFCAIPMIGDDNMVIATPADVGFVSPTQPGNLFQSSLKNLNTYKAMLYDRDFVDPDEELYFYGHIRLTFNNTTLDAVSADFEANIRAWYKSWNFILGPVIVV